MCGWVVRSGVCGGTIGPAGYGAVNDLRCFAGKRVHIST